MKIVAIIPARYDSVRFPGKPLATIINKPMIYWVYKSISNIKEIDQVYVATDDERIKSVVEKFGQVIMTKKCNCGTDRVYEASKNIDCDIILNIQGDEPLLKKEMITKLISAFKDKNVKMATLKKKIINKNQINDNNIVKVITDMNNDAIYFSRMPIPYNRDGIDVSYYKHIGIYAYTKEFLNKYISLEESNLEKIEKLEQLRAIENGYKIRVVETNFESISVDLPEHIELVEREMKKNNE